MKKLVLVLIATMAINLVYAQKPDDLKVDYNFKLYPKVSFAKEINTFIVEFDALSYVLEGVKETFKDGKYYVEMDGKRGVTGVRINGMTQVFSPENSLNVKVIARTGKTEADFVKATKAALGNQDLVQKYKKAVNVSVVVSANGKDLKEYKYSLDVKPESDYILRLKNKEAAVQRVFAFKHNKAEASFILDNVFSGFGTKISKDLNKDFSESTNKLSLEFYTIKAKKFNYDEYNALIESSTKDFKAGKFDGLEDFESKMKDYLSKVDYNDKKAQYPKNLAAKFYINILNAYLLANEYDKVVEVYKAMDSMVQSISNADKATAKSAHDWAAYIKYNYSINAHRM